VFDTDGAEQRKIIFYVYPLIKKKSFALSRRTAWFLSREQDPLIVATETPYLNSSMTLTHVG